MFADIVLVLAVHGCRVPLSITDSLPLRLTENPNLLRRIRGISVGRLDPAYEKKRFESSGYTTKVIGL